MNTSNTENTDLIYGYFCGTRGYEIAMTPEQADSASHQGDCSADVEALSRVPAIAAQLDSFTPEQYREALREYGAWDETELADDTQNRYRALWSAACDAKENNRELFV